MSAPGREATATGSPLDGFAPFLKFFAACPDHLCSHILTGPTLSCLSCSQVAPRAGAKFLCDGEGHCEVSFVLGVGPWEESTTSLFVFPTVLKGWFPASPQQMFLYEQHIIGELPGPYLLPYRYVGGKLVSSPSFRLSCFVMFWHITHTISLHLVPLTPNPSLLQQFWGYGLWPQYRLDLDEKYIFEGHPSSLLPDAPPPKSYTPSHIMQLKAANPDGPSTVSRSKASLRSQANPCSHKMFGCSVSMPPLQSVPPPKRFYVGQFVEVVVPVSEQYSLFSAPPPPHMYALVCGTTDAGAFIFRILLLRKSVLLLADQADHQANLAAVGGGSGVVSVGGVGSYRAAVSALLPLKSDIAITNLDVDIPVAWISNKPVSGLPVEVHNSVCSVGASVLHQVMLRQVACLSSTAVPFSSLEDFLIQRGSIPPFESLLL